MNSGEESLEEVQSVFWGGGGLRLCGRPGQGELQHEVIMGLIRDLRINYSSTTSQLIDAP